MTETVAEPDAKTESLPWQALSDYYCELQDALRAAQDADSEFAQDFWMAEYNRAAANVEVTKDHLAGIGELLLTLALERGSVQLQKKLALAFNINAKHALLNSRKALAWARAARDEIDALRAHIRALEKRLDSLTPGVGEPGKTL